MKRVFIFLIGALFVFGCSQFDPNVGRSQGPVAKMAIGEPAEVSALQLAKVMHTAGFTRQEILDFGPKVRNALAESGGAQVHKDGRVEALFSVQRASLFVASRHRGTFIEELPTVPGVPIEP